MHPTTDPDQKKRSSKWPEKIDHRVVGEQHLKLRLQLVDSEHSIDAIAFNFQNFGWDNRADIVYAAYELDVNRFRGVDTAQLLIRYLDIKATH